MNITKRKRFLFGFIEGKFAVTSTIPYRQTMNNYGIVYNQKYDFVADITKNHTVKGWQVRVPRKMKKRIKNNLN